MHCVDLINRRREIATILDHIGKRRHLHIYGKEGVGKSALLNLIYNDWKEIESSLIPIYCRNSRPFREILIQLAGFILGHFKVLKSIDKFKSVKEIKYPTDIKKLNTTALKNLIFAYISQARFCVILDHLECVTPKINSFLTALYEKALVITASRQSWELTDYGFKGNLVYRLFLIPKFKIENLSKEDSFSLMERLAGGAFREDRRLFEEVYHITKGNAGLISEIILKALLPQYCVSGYPNLKLIQLDLNIEKAVIDPSVVKRNEFS